MFEGLMNVFTDLKLLSEFETLQYKTAYYLNSISHQFIVRKISFKLLYYL